MKRAVIPGYTNYEITENGEVFRVDNGQRVVGSANPKGYHNHRLKGDDGQTKTIGRHRLMAMTFIPTNLNIDNLTVNHKNAVKGDDWLGNLEWTTYQQNQEHAGLHRLTTKCIPVTVVHEKTGLETSYDSMIKCAHDLNLTKDTIAWRISKGPNKIWPDGRRYKKTLDGEVWSTQPEKATGRSRETLVKNLRTGTTLIFNGLKEAAAALNINMGVAWKWANDLDQPVIPGFFLIQFRDQFQSWRTVSDAQEDLQKTTGRKAVVREKDRKIDVFFSLTRCARDSGLKPSTLHHHLKKDYEFVDIESYRFWYYDNLPERIKTKVRLSSNG